MEEKELSKQVCNQTATSGAENNSSECPKCHAQIEDGAIFCSNCGKRIPRAKEGCIFHIIYLVIFLVISLLLTFLLTYLVSLLFSLSFKQIGKIVAMPLIGSFLASREIAKDLTYGLFDVVQRK